MENNKSCIDKRFKLNGLGKQKGGKDGGKPKRIEQLLSLQYSFQTCTNIAVQNNVETSVC